MWIENDEFKVFITTALFFPKDSCVELFAFLAQGILDVSDEKRGQGRKTRGIQ